MIGAPVVLREVDKAQTSFHLRRSRTLRSLARSSSRNGSQFAILLVNPSGEHVELYASEALRDHLGRWLGDVREEAKETVRRYQRERELKARQGVKSTGADKVYGPNGEMFDPGPGTDGATDEEDGGGEQQDAPPKAPPRPPGGSNYDEFLPSPSRVFAKLAERNGTSLAPHASSSSSSRVTRSNSTTHLSSRQQPSPAPSPAPAASPASALSPAAGPSSGPARSPTPHLPWQFTPESLLTWYEGKFSDFNHKTDKVILKAWIKAIEPHKQTRYPYREGDETRPAWWPTNVRHKEPDHLNKHERVALLIHLARFSPCSTDELDASLNNVASQLAIDKLAITREICRVAKEERLAIKRSGNGTFDSFSVTLGPIPAPPPPKKDDDDSEHRHHNTRHRTRRSLGGNNTSDSLAPPSSSRDHLPTPLQQTPRPSVRASPYPLSRSHSTSEMDPAFASPVRSPALGSSSSASGMTRSQSLAGPISSAGKPRAVRQSGRHSLGEADLLDPSNSKAIGGETGQSLQATPYRVNGGGAGGRPQITPRQGQGSPLAGASMTRSYSTGALNGGGAGPTPMGGAGGAANGSASKVKASLIDDSVASPAMIKSRSRLSQQHFDSMGLGNGKAAKGGRGGGGPSQQQHLQQQQQQLPQPHFHPHHLQQFDPQQPPQRPPLPHSHTQPLPHGHLPQPQQAHLVHQPQQGQQHVLVYPPGSSVPQLVRQPSSGGGGIPIHPAHQLQIQQNLHAQAQQHLHQQHQHQFATQQNGHHGPPPQVQVQVNVHAGHSLPPPPHQQEYEQHLLPLPPPPPHQQQQLHHPPQQQQRQPYPSTYPTPQTASSFGASPSPFLAQQQQHSHHQQQHQANGSPYLSHGDHFAPSQADFSASAGVGVDAALFAGNGGVPSPMVGDGFFGVSPNAGGGGGGGMDTSPYGASPGMDGGVGGVGGGDGDLSMYVQQLEVLEAQQQQQQQQHMQLGATGGGGFEDSLGLGLGMGMGMEGMEGMEGMNGGMGLEPGYYGEEGSGFGAVVGA